MEDKNKTILVTGAQGLVGTALIEELKREGYTQIVSCTREACDLRNFEAVKSFFSSVQPHTVFHAAAAVYGIGGNLKNRGSVFLDNILINTHVIEASRAAQVKKIVAMGTVAAYPEPKTVPVKEDQIWEGPPHASESSYAHAKRAMLAQLLAYQENYGIDFAYVVSTNLYGPNDRFDIEGGHVIPSLVRKFYEAKKNGVPVVIWGDGTAARDFLYCKDMARALVLLMNRFSGTINVASGAKTLIREIVDVLADYFDMQGQVKWDPTKPNGRIYHELDITKLKLLGFQPFYDLKEGLKETYDWFVSKYEENLVRK